MFVFDIETLGVESTTVILSAAIIHFDPTEKPDYDKLLADSLFVKFDAKEQIEQYKRTITKSTIDWWAGQHSAVRKMSFDPDPIKDLPATEAFAKINDYMKRFPNYDKCVVWARGSLDQMAIDSLARKVGVPEITRYNLWRDVRTAIDCLYDGNNGYCDVDHPTFKSYDVVKHNPIHDAALDVMQLLYGKTK